MGSVVTHTIYIEDQGGHIYEIGCRNTRTEADEVAALFNRDPKRGRLFVLSAGAPQARGQGAGDSRAPRPELIFGRAAW